MTAGLQTRILTSSFEPKSTGCSNPDRQQKFRWTLRPGRPIFPRLSQLFPSPRASRGFGGLLSDDDKHRDDTRANVRIRSPVIPYLPAHSHLSGIRAVAIVLAGLWMAACGGGTAVDRSSSVPPPPPAQNQAPVADAGSDRTVTTGTLVMLDGSGSSDPDGDPLTYQWTLDSRPPGSGAALASNNTVTTSFRADVEGDYAISLVVSDGRLNSGPGSVTIDADDVQLPIGSTIVSANVMSVAGNSQGDVPVTFGQVFAPGHVPAGATLAARTAGGGGTGLPVQIDAMATHSDGSLRHGVITTRIPVLPAGGVETIELVSANPGSGGGAVDVAELLASGFDTTVSLNVGGMVYSASARDLVIADSGRTWLQGPLVTEWIVSGPVTTSSGAQHPQLTAQFYIRAYAGIDRVRVDVIVENNWTFDAGTANRNYDVTITVGGNQVYARNAFQHYHHARWRRVFWWGSEPEIHLAHDASYLIATGAVPNYDQSVVVSATALNDEEQNWLNADTDIGGAGLLEPFMPQPGGRQDIGPLPRFAARYLLSMDRRAGESTLGSGDLSGSWPIHLRDRNTGLPVSIETYPDIFWDNLPGTSAGTGSLVPDRAHQPSLAYVPYLVTGDHYYLEEMQFWTTWNWVIAAPGDRDRGDGILGGNLQTRGHAWVLRNLGHTAYATPDVHPLKNYFIQRLNNAIAWYDVNFTNNPSANQLGWMSGYAATGAYDPVWSSWEDDFLTQVVGGLYDAGFAQSSDFLFYKARYAVGLMTDPGYCYVFATAYRKVLGTGGNYFSTFSEIYQPTLESSENGYSAAVGLPCGSAAMGTSVGLAAGAMVQDYWPYSYASNLYGALSAAVDIGYPGAEQAFDTLAGRVDPVRSGEGYDYDPTFAIVPRSLNKTVLP